MDAITTIADIFYKEKETNHLDLFTSLKDDDARIRLSQGTAPANNPFLLVNAAGTDFSRSHSRFATHNVSVTASYRF